jgi:hypothetical protein
MKKQKHLDSTSRLIEAPEGSFFIASSYLCNQFLPFKARFGNNRAPVADAIFVYCWLRSASVV